jgi:integrase
VRYRPLPAFAAAPGLRPEEWGAAERRDVDRRERILNVRRTISSGEVVELGKTSRSRRQVPLSRRALEALAELTPRLDPPPLFPAPAGGQIDLHNFRNPERAPGGRGLRGPWAGPPLRPAQHVRAERAGGGAPCSSWRR